MKPSLLSVLCAAFLVSQAHAQGLLQTNRISADLANQAVAAVVAKCASQVYAETSAPPERQAANSTTPAPAPALTRFKDQLK